MCACVHVCACVPVPVCVSVRLSSSAGRGLFQGFLHFDPHAQCSQAHTHTHTLADPTHRHTGEPNKNTHWRITNHNTQAYLMPFMHYLVLCVLRPKCQACNIHVIYALFQSADYLRVISAYRLFTCYFSVQVIYALFQHTGCLRVISAYMLFTRYFSAQAIYRLFQHTGCLCVISAYRLFHCITIILYLRQQINTTVS